MKLTKILLIILFVLSFRIDIESQELKQDREETCYLKFNNKISIEYLTKLFDIDSNCILYYLPMWEKKEVLIKKIISKDLRIEYGIVIDDKDTVIFKRPFNQDTIKNFNKEFIQALYKIKSDEIRCIFADSIFDSYFSK